MTNPYEQSFPNAGASQSGSAPGTPNAGANPYPSSTPPPNNLGWAIAGAFFLLPLALAAFFSSSKVEILWRLGDFEGAQKASADAKKFGSLALWIGLGLIALGCISYIGIIAATISSISSTH
ncbi:Interferon-induced transmembrane protein [Segniliparus rotundus DSM 44985]|uniref:Interferon-induced transmembrane protein n=1 Tax=Segniliparus rotundus (strain ATCC BAA-972 / CDC 1076 / CIP 108378 / DSM 44985 / JCM 13578) TaxID=640132 RepID=D6ZC82_SEGRD|nr:CD225/dispanin family protein [Segniliparus rotundus]ADG99051.1 Interferon-induced transmembrane protein [Segniliparus rotundus DSM 44985]